jgi:signal transduction histidine kinase
MSGPWIGGDSGLCISGEAFIFQQAGRWQAGTMETLPLALLAGAALIAVLSALCLLRRVQAVEALMARTEGQLAARGRSLALVARELEAPGLSLLGLAARLSHEPAAVVAAEGRRLLSLSEEVSDLLAAQSGPRSLVENRIPFGPLLREALAEVTLPLGEAARHWRVAPELEALTLLADRRALKRALSQSLARAARETRPGDQIAIRLVRAAETVAVVIEDEGAGLPPGDLSGIEGTRGLILGLAAARELLRAHGGELTLEAAPGIGGRTWLTLPRGRVLSDGGAVKAAA